jgi:Ribbon-helix-helix protein, copG family
MGHTVTIRIPSDLAQWLAERAKRSGISQGQLIREQLERARAEKPDQPFMRLAGSLTGLPKSLSKRKGYSRS